VGEINSSHTPCSTQVRDQAVLTEIQKDVVATLAPSQINREPMDCDDELLAQRNEPSFQKSSVD
jgi:hypothetical protein